LQDPEELKDWREAGLVSKNDSDIENIPREELERYPLIKMSFAQFVSHYFDK